MKQAAKALAMARKKYKKLSDEFAEKSAEWEASVADLMQQVLDAKVAMLDAENSLRETAIASYEADPGGGKHLPFGVIIRSTKTLCYSLDEATSWALEHRIAITLNKRAFEKIAKASPPPFVEIKEVLKVGIPVDTAKLLKE